MTHPEFLMKDHGYVVLASVGAFVLHMWLSFKVGAARKKYNVKYPAMYSDKEERFNCIQRAHQNTLEGIPFYLSLLFTAGIRHPCVSTPSTVTKSVLPLGPFSGPFQTLYLFRGPFPSQPPITGLNFVLFDVFDSANSGPTL